MMPMRSVSTCLIIVAMAMAGARRSGAQSPFGIWRGTSTCLVRPSACNDEVVVYRIAAMKASDSATVDARKIVGGAEQEMGILACRVSPPAGPLTCRIPRGAWWFQVRGDSLLGELRLADNTKFRDVRAARATK